MYSHTVYERIRYSQTDKMGYLYYGNYAAFYEIGRVEALRNLGISYKEMEDDGVLMVVGSLESKYILPGFYDEELKITTHIKNMPKFGTMIFYHSVYNPANELINKGVVKIVCVNIDTRKKIRVPTQLEDALKPYFER